MSGLGTHKVMAESPKKTQGSFVNRLIAEDSPYLQQHAHNPVNWYPWGEEAFAKAKRENKPIFLSIGYSTCFWCHVMARESFENQIIADVLNQHFISIKVDRERRPDVDALYMAAVTLISGSSGWPMSSFLTPEGKAFIGGSYFPPEKFKQLLVKINQLWQKQPQLLLDKAETVSKELERQFDNQSQAKTINQTLLTSAKESLLLQYDRLNGGFGYKPKFPHESRLLYLLEYALHFDDMQALNIVEKSLQAMANGGIYDFIGGGFHRYATDEQWLIPHFEKMLYNQAQLCRLYLSAYQITGNVRFAQIAAQTLNYVLDELTSEQGGFYSATDAESPEGEGAYYLWTIDQLKHALSPELAALAIDRYGVTEQGNFEGKNILNRRLSIADYAGQSRLDKEKLIGDLGVVQNQLKMIRAQRTEPHKDDKVIIAWNAMMIQTLAIAGEVLGQDKYLAAAKKAAEFILAQSDSEQQRLWRVYWQGRSSIPANQEDYAYLADALIQLYDATGENVWLDRAENITNRMLALFWDDQQGVFFMNTVAKGEPMPLRLKVIKDNEIAAANAVAFRVLSRLSKRHSSFVYAQKATQLLASLSQQVAESTLDYSYLLLAATEFLYGESGAVQYAAKGALTAKARAVNKGPNIGVEVEIKLKPGWHINAHQPLQKFLIATDLKLSKRIQGWQLEHVQYPDPVKKKLGFQREKLALYEEKVLLHGNLTRSSSTNNFISLKLHLQACNDKVCLPPEELKLFVPVHKVN